MSSSDPSPATFGEVPGGVGLGLRWSFLDEVAESGAPASISSFEISPENYMRRGGYFPDALARVASRHPLLSHGLMLNIGSTDPLDVTYLETLRRFLDELGLPAHSDHLCWTGVDGRCFHDLLPLPARPDVVEHIVARVAQVQDALARPLALENISYYLDPDPKASVPEHLWVAEVIERAQCQLLLDVNNVWVNAQNHGLDPYEILRAMPLDRVAYLHVAGGERLAGYDGLIIDSHGTAVNEEVAALMAWVVTRTGPVPVIYERDHHIPTLEQLDEEVRGLESTYQAAVQRWRDRERAESERRTRPVVLRSEPGEPSEPKPLAELLSAFANALLGEPVAPAVATLQEPGGAVPPRVAVYERLFRATVLVTVRRFMPRTAARLGEADFEAWVSRWLVAQGPQSPYLRDLPHAFGAFVTERWKGSDRVPGFLIELAQHELLEMMVAASPPRASAPSPEAGPRDADGAPLSLEVRFEFDPSVHQVVYRHRIHELPADPLDQPDPEPGRTSLLAYRDGKHAVRYLEMSRLGEALVRQLRRGEALGDAVAGAAEAASLPLDDAVLLRAATLLADLGGRGVLWPATRPNTPA